METYKHKDKQYKVDGVWLVDENGNKNSWEYHGSVEAAAKALYSLENCNQCINCYGCYGCYDCSDCSGCYSKKEEKVTGEYPEIKGIHSIVLDAATKTDESLDMSDWHTCGTTHCRAGWVVILAGEDGKKLEKETSTEFAAMMIYKASSEIRVNPAMFYVGNKESIADMERCEKLEADL